LSKEENQFLDLSAALRDERQQEKEEQRQRELEAARKLRNRAWIVTGLVVCWSGIEKRGREYARREKQKNFRNSCISLG
jgi:hypothetical protein